MILPLSKTPNFHYEALAREAFKCFKSGDPWGYAAQDRYDGFFVKKGITGEGKKALSTILIAFVIEFQGNTKCESKFVNLEKEVWSCDSQSSVDAVIDKAIQLYNDCEKNNDS